MSVVKKNKIREELETAILAAAKQISANINPGAKTSTLIHNSKWTVGDSAAHLVISQRLFKNVLLGKKSPYGDGRFDAFAEVNDKFLKEFKERDGLKLAALIIKETNFFIKEVNLLPDSYLLDTHFGRMELVDGMRYCLCHLLMHGSDIARALYKPVPVNPTCVSLILPFFKKGMSERYDKKAVSTLNARVDINVKGVSRFAIICRQGKVKIENEIPKSVDCHISVDPITFFLVSTGVVSLWKPLLKGKILVWGRKPWLALKLKTIFPNP